MTPVEIPQSEYLPELLLRVIANEDQAADIIGIPTKTQTPEHMALVLSKSIDTLPILLGNLSSI